MWGHGNRSQNFGTRKSLPRWNMGTPAPNLDNRDTLILFRDHSTMETYCMMVSVAPSWSTTRRLLSICDGGRAIGLLSRGHDYHHVVSRHCTEPRSSVSQNFGSRKCGVWPAGSQVLRIGGGPRDLVARAACGLLRHRPCERQQ